VIVLAKTDKVFGLIRSGKIWHVATLEWWLVWIGGIILKFAIFSGWILMIYPDPFAFPLKPYYNPVYVFICIYPIISKAFSRLLYSIIMSYYVIYFIYLCRRVLMAFMVLCWPQCWRRRRGDPGSVGIRGDGSPVKSSSYWGGITWHNHPLISYSLVPFGYQGFDMFWLNTEKSKKWCTIVDHIR